MNTDHDSLPQNPTAESREAIIDDIGRPTLVELDSAYYAALAAFVALIPLIGLTTLFLDGIPDLKDLDPKNNIGVLIIATSFAIGKITISHRSAITQVRVDLPINPGDPTRDLRNLLSKIESRIRACRIHSSILTCATLGTAAIILIARASPGEILTTNGEPEIIACKFSEDPLRVTIQTSNWNGNDIKIIVQRGDGAEGEELYHYDTLKFVGDTVVSSVVGAHPDRILQFRKNEVTTISITYFINRLGSVYSSIVAR